MRNEWRVRGAFDQILIVGALDACEEEVGRRLEPLELASRLHDWFPASDASEESTRTLLLELIGAAFGDPCVHAHETSTRDLRDAVEQGFSAGRLLAVVLPEPKLYNSSRAIEPPELDAPAPTPARAPARDRAWLGIALVDQDGVAVPSKRYRVTLPDGTVREGTLDSQGRAQIESQMEGACKVSFPDLDSSMWGPA